MNATIHRFPAYPTAISRKVQKGLAFKVGHLFVSFEERLHSDDHSYCLVVSDPSKPWMRSHYPYFLKIGESVTLSNDATITVKAGGQRVVDLKILTDLFVSKPVTRSGGWLRQ